MKFEKFDGINYPEMEKSLLARWKGRDTFGLLIKKNANGPRWSFLDGPITANNPMGVHHGWGRTYKDIFQRFHAMKGEQLPYRNGFDCHGLWVEVEVEKELGFKSKQDIEAFGLDKFSQACRDRVNRFAERITEQSVRLGQWMDWGNSYFTMSNSNIQAIWAFLQKCQEKDLLYNGQKVMPWCCRCGTSLATHELSDGYKEVTTDSLYFAMQCGWHKGSKILVWTTTPWTVPANTAIAVNPDAIYDLVRLDDGDYWMSQKHHEKFYSGRPCSDQTQGIYLTQASTFPGLGENQIYTPPFPKSAEVVEYRIVPWAGVNPEEGTGFVHIAPGCGEADYQLALEHDLQILNPLHDNGHCNTHLGFGDVFYKKANDMVIEKLGAKEEPPGKGVRLEKYKHRYPHCWRCKSPLVYRLKNEWFIKTEPIREELKAAAAKVTWHPPYIADQMQDWLNNMQDWCISRRRFWGLPLPFWTCPDGHMHVMDARKLGEYGSSRHLPVGADWMHRPWIDQMEVHCPSCGKNMNRTEAVGDCWLDAGIVPFSTMDEEWFPAEAVCEMREQVRLWFYSMLVMSVVLEGRPPYKNVITYEEMRDEKGEAFSKTKGNNLVFDEMADKLGADPMRWVFALAPTTKTFYFGNNTTKDAQRRLLMLWNCYKFMADYAELNDPAMNTPPATDGDRWLMARMNQVVKRVTSALDGFNTQAAALELQSWVDDISLYYIRMNRQRFVQGDDAAFTALYTALVVTCQLLAPILPFTAEKLFLNLQGGESVHLTPWPTPDPKWDDEELLSDVVQVREVISKALAERSRAGIKIRQPLPELSVPMLATAVAKPEFRDQVLSEVNVKAIKFHAGDPAVILTTTLTQALVEEGTLREIIRMIQDLRKEMKLKPGDKVKVWCQHEVGLKHAATIMEKCWAVEVVEGTPELHENPIIHRVDKHLVGITRV